MNKYIRKFFGSMFRSQQTQQVVRIPLQHAPTSPEEWRQYWQAKGFPGKLIEGLTNFVLKDGNVH